MSDNDRTERLYEKYKIRRTDGGNRKGRKHEHCDYFVLDLVHDKHAIAALSAYIQSCGPEYPLLADDLRRRLERMIRETPL